MRSPSLMLGLLLIATPAMAAAPSDADSARGFVQAFYDWYVKLDVDSDSALRKKPAWFSPELTKALEADETAATKSPDEVVGLDFDPFLNAQDVCSPYKVSTVKQAGDAYEVAVLGSCADTEPGTPDVIAQVVKHGASWVFTDFIYPARDSQAQDDLLSVLKALQRERDKAPK